jgi:hypothetical protein
VNGKSGRIIDALSAIAGLPHESRATKLFGVPRSDQDRYSAGGLGNHLDQMNGWLDANCGADG